MIFENAGVQKTLEKSELFEGEQLPDVRDFESDTFANREGLADSAGNRTRARMYLDTRDFKSAAPKALMDNNPLLYLKFSCCAF